MQTDVGLGLNLLVAVPVGIVSSTETVSSDVPHEIRAGMERLVEYLEAVHHVFQYNRSPMRHGSCVHKDISST